MSDYGITQDNLMHSFPVALSKDPKMIALAKSVANVLAHRRSEIKSLLIYNRIDELPEELLDILAHDFAVDWYDYDLSLEAKRRTIKTMMYIHRHRGTTGAVVQGVCNIYPGSRVEEWWQYGGEPYHFRIILDMGQAPESLVETDRIMWAIGYYKSLRSHNDGVYYQSTFIIEVGCSTGYVVYAVRRCGTYPRRATQGGRTDGNIVIETDEWIGNYSHPRTGDLSAGIFPHTATQGGTVGADIEVAISTAEAAYSPQRVTGIYPHTATQGTDLTEGIAVVTGKYSTVYDTPATGDATTGTHPATATQGGANSSGLSTGETGFGTAYTIKRCGSTSGSFL